MDLLGSHQGKIPEAMLSECPLLMGSQSGHRRLTIHGWIDAFELCDEEC
jgi:hypothetical protein